LGTRPPPRVTRSDALAVVNVAVAFHHPADRWHGRPTAT
jgi:hypothetical protein